jgi:CRP-like cAMP-binding protein
VGPTIAARALAVVHTAIYDAWTAYDPVAVPTMANGNGRRPPAERTVTAETPVRLFVLTRRDFRDVLDRNPSVERKVLQALARRLVETSSDPTLA